MSSGETELTGDGRATETKLFVVCGAPGVGKTTVARTVADALDAELLRTDVVRKELFPDPSYTTEESRATYAELRQRAQETLEAGQSAVLDGTFQHRDYRARVDELADGLEVPLRFLKVECEERRVRRRIAAREDDESDADFEIHKHVKSSFDSFDREHAVVDNSGSPAETRRQIESLLESGRT